MTTDLLLTVATHQGPVLVARSVKPDLDLSKRTREKLEVERRYWKALGVSWALITKAQVNPVLIRNWRALLAFFDLSRVCAPYPGYYEEMSAYALRTFFPCNDKTLSEWADSLDAAFGVPGGNALNVLKNLIATKRLFTDMQSPEPLESRPLVALHCNYVGTNP